MIIQPFRRNAIYHLTERQSFLISDINIQFCHPMQNNMIRISLSVPRHFEVAAYCKNTAN